MTSTFSNWSGLITSSPEIIRSIATLEEAIQAVNYAQEEEFLFALWDQHTLIHLFSTMTVE